jgi:hypothetical protein
MEAMAIDLVDIQELVRAEEHLGQAGKRFCSRFLHGLIGVEVDFLLLSEVFLAFAGWLTSRQNPLTVSVPGQNLSMEPLDCGLCPLR